MEKNTNILAGSVFKSFFFMIPAIISACFFQACDSDDPDPVNEEEVITTVNLTLVPEGGGDAVILRFYDADGEQGSVEPVITVSGPLASATTYTGVVELSNETANPAVDVSEEIAEEAEDHLFCYNTIGDLSIVYEDEDDNGRPLGMVTSWTTGAAGEASVTVALRHQAGTKTGECPGTGETDVEVTFPLIVE